jgi:signal transduction histidine kinase
MASSLRPSVIAATPDRLEIHPLLWPRALLVAVAYLLGGQIDSILESTSSPAIIWPPNAVLLTALLLSPRHTWWIYLVAVAPADRFTSWRDGVQWLPALGLYISNTGQSLIAASLLRWWCGRGAQWDRIGFILEFIWWAAIVAPTIAAISGAAAVHRAHAEVAFWSAWGAWFSANALTNLLLVPPLMCGVAKSSQRSPPQAPSPIRGSKMIRLAEIGSAFCGLLAIVLYIFEFSSALHAGSQSLLYVAWPVLIWAALRLGPGGVSAANVLLAGIAIHGTVHGRGPFTSGSTALSVFHLQLFLVTVCCSMLLLAGVIRERQQTITALNASQHELLENRDALQAGQLHIQLLAGRLIAAQEEERRRIARELHDGINQDLAAVSIALSRLRLRLGANDPSLGEVTELGQRVFEIGDDVRQMSHALHPGMLRHAGLVAAVRGHCATFGAEHGIEVTFQADEDLPLVPGDDSLCLFRIAQEAMANAVRHGGATRIDVAIQNSGGERLCLRVADNGAGFDVARAQAGSGLGLISMQERARAVGGEVVIEGHSGRGAVVQARVPMRGNPHESYQVASG